MCHLKVDCVGSVKTETVLFTWADVSLKKDDFANMLF